uniref:Delta 9 desaturase n=1 Tax=Rhizophora mucronata TaxID=61149 RepID=A0A2P2IR69_RHIMU
MALTTSPFANSKPCPLFPTFRLKKLNTPSLVLNFRSSYSKLHLQKINCKGVKSPSSFVVSAADKHHVKRTVVESDEPDGEIPQPEPKAKNFGRILLSDVVVKRKRNVFWSRKWSSLDISTAGVILAMHLLSLFAPFCFNWGAFWVAFGLYVVTGLLGITLSFHRNLSHRSFKLPKWLEYLFAYCGVQALQVNL